ncbi:MAG: bifunctional folylpolyglutamate synthase/dihydrofolate synthase [Chitinophagaceae bacterium]|nr:bifunctional folylpolyglutamate synthase/dihydrofolate synthase [Chitinophagaceae bacterium]
MNYSETIDYLFTRLPMFSRIGAAAYKTDLTNTVTLCEALGNPQTKFKSLHIAGTNGKGSVSHMLAAILQTAGYKTGLHTSPHLKDFRERIRINGEMVNEAFVIDFTERIKPLIEKIEPSFFEITVAMAFEYFAQEKVDIAIIETGLGGRLDSTNIITPELSVITNIGFDHVQFLGDTLEKIAVEKAGIIKEGIPVVIGELHPETKEVFTRVAAEKNAPISFASQKRQVTNWKWQQHQLMVEVANEHHADHKTYHLDLPGIYQTKNILSVLEACSILQERGWNSEDTVIQKALLHVKKLTGLAGRWEIVHTSPLVVLDVAHNEDGIRQLVQQIEMTEHHQLHIITGMVKDKDVEKVLHLLPKEATYYFTKAHIPRALTENELSDKALHAGIKGSIFENVNTALKTAMQKAKPADMIVVCGSIFLVGEVNTSALPASPAHT